MSTEQLQVQDEEKATERNGGWMHTLLRAAAVHISDELMLLPSGCVDEEPTISPLLYLSLTPRNARNVTSGIMHS